MGKLDGKKVAFLATDGVEQVELTEPWKTVEEEGGTRARLARERRDPGLRAPRQGPTFQVDRTVKEASEGDDDGSSCRAAWRTRAFRTDEDAVSFVRSFFEAGKPVAVICHGPWTLVEADVVRDRKITSGRASGRTSGTPAATGSTRRSWWTTASSRAASPTTSRPSAPSWPRRSARDATRNRRLGRVSAVWAAPIGVTPCRAGIAQLNVPDEEELDVEDPAACRMAAP